LAVGLALVASIAVAQSPADGLVQQLREQGYVEFTVSRTLLGRVRVVALAPDGSQREIVFNPATGEILRDYSEAAYSGVAPRILGRPEGENGSLAASSPPGSDGGVVGTSQPDGEDDGNNGHGNNAGGFDSDNPGQGHGGDGTPGGGNPSPGSGGNGNPSRGGGNGKSQN
jgi:hypothetical protein